MMKPLIKFLNFIIILAFEAWFLWPSGNWRFEWEPLIGFIAAIITYLGVEGHEHFQKHQALPQPSPKDIELFEKLIELLPSTSLAKFYKEHDFLASFQGKYVDPLYEFIETWDNPEHEFIDKELEKSKIELYESAKALGMTIAKNTVPNRVGLISVKSDTLPPGPTPDWVKKDAKEINDLAPSFVNKHESFVRLGYKKLFG